MASFLQKIGKLLGQNVASVSSTQAHHARHSARSVARDRLSVILASQRGSELLVGVDMEAMQQDVLRVVQVCAKYDAVCRILCSKSGDLRGSSSCSSCVQKHIQVAKDKPVQCQITSEGEVNLFEMSVELEATGRSSNGPTGVSLAAARS